jgi:hypothetical protein
MGTTTFSVCIGFILFSLFGNSSDRTFDQRAVLFNGMGERQQRR